jgi:hypothetical protein
MLIIGLLIALAAAIFVAVVLAEDWGGATYTIHGFGHTLGNLTLAEIFLSGIIITAIFFAALWLASVSNRMRRRASARRRAETRSMREEHENAIADRDRLARELEAERASHASGATYPRDTATYPRDTEVYGNQVDPANPDTAYPAYPGAREQALTDEESRRHTV